MAPPVAVRGRIAKDTIARSASITSSTPGASSKSQFIAAQLPPLTRPTVSPSNTKADKSKPPHLIPNHPTSKIRVVNKDAFTAARDLVNELQGEGTVGKVGVLNLASDEHEGGGWLQSLATTQEEALCYSSTLYSTLLRKPSYYPWPNLGPKSIAGMFSPSVVVFKHDLDRDCVDLEEGERMVVSVMTVAAPRWPELSKVQVGGEGDEDGEWEYVFKKESDLDDLRGKIRLVYRMAGWNGVESLILGAMGCGAYACPPHLVAREMKSILLEDEFRGWFRRVLFAVYGKGAGWNGPGNFEVFSGILDGVELLGVE